MVDVPRSSHRKKYCQSVAYTKAPTGPDLSPSPSTAECSTSTFSTTSTTCPSSPSSSPHTHNTDRPSSPMQHSSHNGKSSSSSSSSHRKRSSHSKPKLKRSITPPTPSSSSSSTAEATNLGDAPPDSKPAPTIAPTETKREKSPGHVRTPSTGGCPVSSSSSNSKPKSNVRPKSHYDMPRSRGMTLMQPVSSKSSSITSSDDLRLTPIPPRSHSTQSTISSQNQATISEAKTPTASSSSSSSSHSRTGRSSPVQKSQLQDFSDSSSEDENITSRDYDALFAAALAGKTDKRLEEIPSDPAHPPLEAPAAVPEVRADRRTGPCGQQSQAAAAEAQPPQAVCYYDKQGEVGDGLLHGGAAPQAVAGASGEAERFSAEPLTEQVKVVQQMESEQTVSTSTVLCEGEPSPTNPSEAQPTTIEPSEQSHVETQPLAECVTEEKSTENQTSGSQLSNYESSLPAKLEQAEPKDAPQNIQPFSTYSSFPTYSLWSFAHCESLAPSRKPFLRLHMPQNLGASEPLSESPGTTALLTESSALSTSVGVGSDSVSSLDSLDSSSSSSSSSSSESDSEPERPMLSSSPIISDQPTKCSPLVPEVISFDGPVSPTCPVGIWKPGLPPRNPGDPIARSSSASELVRYENQAPLSPPPRLLSRSSSEFGNDIVQLPSEIKPSSGCKDISDAQVNLHPLQLSSCADVNDEADTIHLATPIAQHAEQSETPPPNLALTPDAKSDTLHNAKIELQDPPKPHIPNETKLDQKSSVLAPPVQHPQNQKPTVQRRAELLSRTKSISLLSSLVNSNKLLAIELIKAWVQRVKEIPVDDLTLDIFVSHFAKIHGAENHPLYHYFSRSILAFTKFIYQSPGLGSDGTAALIRRQATECCDRIVDIAIDKWYSDLFELDVWIERALWEVVFDLNYKSLWGRYCKKFHTEDEDFKAGCSKLQDITTQSLGISRRFCLSTPSPFLLAQEGSANYTPYKDSINEIKKLDTLTTPWLKLNCLVKVGAHIVGTVEQHWGDQLPPDQLNIGADDFLPIISFVLIKGNLDHPFTTFKYIEHFLREEDISGEPAYILTTFQTSLALIEALIVKEVSPPQEARRTPSGELGTLSPDPKLSTSPAKELEPLSVVPNSQQEVPATPSGEETNTKPPLDTKYPGSTESPQGSPLTTLSPLSESSNVPSSPCIVLAPDSSPKAPIGDLSNVTNHITVSRVPSTEPLKTTPPPLPLTMPPLRPHLILPPTLRTSSLLSQLPKSNQAPSISLVPHIPYSAQSSHPLLLKTPPAPSRPPPERLLSNTPQPHAKPLSAQLSTPSEISTSLERPTRQEGDPTLPSVNVQSTASGTEAPLTPPIPIGSAVSIAQPSLITPVLSPKQEPTTEVLHVTTTELPANTVNSPTEDRSSTHKMEATPEPSGEVLLLPSRVEDTHPQESTLSNNLLPASLQPSPIPAACTGSETAVPPPLLPPTTYQPSVVCTPIEPKPALLRTPPSAHAPVPPSAPLRIPATHAPARPSSQVSLSSSPILHTPETLSQLETNSFPLPLPESLPEPPPPPPSPPPLPPAPSPPSFRPKDESDNSKLALSRISAPSFTEEPPLGSLAQQLEASSPLKASTDEHFLQTSPFLASSSSGHESTIRIQSTTTTSIPLQAQTSLYLTVIYSSPTPPVIIHTPPSTRAPIPQRLSIPTTAVHSPSNLPHQLPLTHTETTSAATGITESPSRTSTGTPTPGTA
ncbi:hypothetical protein Pelo_5099 [Pelomyxa schiedti]|nr:hypothetical protein Pelo_5099 [Pelomyxa schiedti]